VPPTSTPTSQPVSGDGGPLLFAVASTANLGGATYQNEDIISFDGSSFSMYFDGSDVMPTGLTIDAFDIATANDLLFSFAGGGSLPGVGSFVDSDILRFRATSLGQTTAGMWTMYFDASDTGLSGSTEDIDAVEMLPNGHLLISTTGNFSVLGVRGEDRDVLRFAPTMLGTTTTGTWSMYLDGSDVGLDGGGEDIDGLASLDGDLYLSTLSSFSVPGLSGQDEDVFVFEPVGLGAASTGAFTSPLYFDGSAYGLGANNIVDLDIP
jgi:hypothetical protein